VFFSKYSDSHSIIAKENKIPDDESSVSVEMTPPDNNFSLPSKAGNFKLTQNILYLSGGQQVGQKSNAEMLPAWAKTHLYIDTDVELDLSEVEMPSLIFINSNVKIKDQQGGECRFYKSSGTVTSQQGVIAGLTKAAGQ
jgi:hypothetical protein